MGTSDLLETAKRRAFVLERRMAGCTYREIASQAIIQFGIDRLPGAWGYRYAHKDVSRELDKLRAIVGEEADQIRQMELERLNNMLRGLWEEASGTPATYGAVDRVLKIQERRAKLLGLDAPTKQEFTGAEGGPVEIRPMPAITEGEAAAIEKALREQASGSGEEE